MDFVAMKWKPFAHTDRGFRGLCDMPLGNRNVNAIAVKTGQFRRPHVW